MNIEKMREEFEAALIAMHVSTGLPKSTATAMIEVKCNGQYASPSTMGDWWAWQASRESLLIELPSIVAYEGAYDSLTANEYCPRMSDVEDADEIFSLIRSIEVREVIEAVGVKTK